MVERLSTYEDFWPFYLSQHRHPVCRRLHVLGTLLALTSVVLGALGSTWFFAAAPVAGYGCAWIGHFVFEKNRPATFTYPLWSLRADWRLFRREMTGRPLVTTNSETGP